MHKKPFHSGKKAFGNNDDASFRKSSDRKEDKPFRQKPGDKEDKPFRKQFGNKEERPFRKSFGKNEDKPFKKPFGNQEDRPFRKSFGGDREDRPFKKFFGDKEERPYRKSEDREDRPFRKSFDKEDRPFRKSFGADRTDRPFKKSFEKEDRGFKKKEDKPVDRYKNTFGKLDDEELIQHRKKREAKKEQNALGEEITFSKELDKWSDEPVERVFGKSDIRPRVKSYNEDGSLQRDPKARFKKHFDKEHEQEKAYASRSEGNFDKENRTPPESLEGKPMPLNKYIAHCDVCSRRDAVVLIKEGKVTVNGGLVTEPGHKVTLDDVVTLNGKELVVQKNLVYILMNKPKGFITTTDDPKGRRTVMEMLENHIEERVFPVGRLDRNTTGLLLLTNDGELAQKLAHPKYEIRKVYKATLDKNLTKADFDKILEGVILEDGQAKVDELEYLDAKNEIGMEIHSGKNRIVRRIFESLGYEVEKLDRVMYAGLTKKHILRGKWRFLTKQEVINIKHLK